MNTENFVINDGSNWEAVEALDKLFPEFKRVTPLALVVKSVDSVDRAALMIATEQKEVFRVFDLVGEQKTNNLQILLAAVNIVA